MSSAGGARAAWLVALLAVLPHLIGLANGFVYDDFRFVVENEGVQSLARPAELVAGVERMSSTPDRDIWRPLRTLLFASEHALFGLEAAAWHAVSLLLHVLLVRGVIAFAATLPGLTAAGAGAAGLLFGVHPLTVESVAWVSSQGDLLAGLFVVVALRLAGIRPWLATAAAALALLAKESALPLVAALVVVRAIRPGSRPRVAELAAVAIVTALYVVARQLVLARGFDLSAAGFSQREAGFGARLLQLAQNVPLALRLFVWPWPLSVDYEERWIGAPGASDAIATLVILSGLVLLLWMRPALRRRAGAPLLLALLFFLPTSGLLVAMKSPIAERFLLLPCAFLAIAAVAAAPPAARPATASALRSVFGVVVAALAVVTFVRTRDFRSDEALWRAELAIHPTSVQARLGLMQAASERRDVGGELAQAEALLALTPPGDARRVVALFRLGQLALEQGREEEGAGFLERCRREVLARGRTDDLRPEVHLAWVGLGNFLRVRAGPAAAEDVLREGIARFGRRPRLLEGLGIVRDQQGDAAGAEALYREALRAPEPGVESASLRYHLALALVHQGRREEARAEAERALTIDDSHVPSRRLREELGN